jgi:hypothetical protein
MHYGIVSWNEIIIWQQIESHLRAGYGIMSFIIYYKIYNEEH